MPLPILLASLRWVWATSGFFQGHGEFEPVLILAGIFILLVFIGLFAFSVFCANSLSARITQREGLAEFMETELTLIWNKRTIKIKYEDISKIGCQLTVLSNNLFPPIGDLYIGLINSKKNSNPTFCCGSLREEKRIHSFEKIGARLYAVRYITLECEP